MMLFAAVIAVLPLVVAGQSIIRIAQDELKSTANEQLVGTARQLTYEFNAFFEYSLFAPLDLIRNAIGGNKLDSAGKIAVLRQGIADLPDVVALQVDIEGHRGLSSCRRRPSSTDCETRSRTRWRSFEWTVTRSIRT